MEPRVQEDYTEKGGGRVGNTKESSLEIQVVSPFGPFHELFL